MENMIREMWCSVQFAVITHIGLDFVDCKIFNVMLVMNMDTWEVTDIVETESHYLRLMITANTVIVMLVPNSANRNKVKEGAE